MNGSISTSSRIFRSKDAPAMVRRHGGRPAPAKAGPFTLAYRSKARCQEEFKLRFFPSRRPTRLAVDHDGSPSTALNERIYAIGDLHGRIDLFAQLLSRIHGDGKQRGSRPAVLVILGDMIDRGPCSREILDLVRRYQQASNSIVALRGNHEDMLLKSVEGNRTIQRLWLQNGGAATLRSYGVDVCRLRHLDASGRAEVIADSIGEETLSWLGQLPVSYRSGDYFFCHAGVRPGLPLSKQRPEDLMWIREDFLWSERDHGAVIVHGHSQSIWVEDQHNRINIDTGAHRTGILSAVGLEGTAKWFLAVSTAQATEAGLSGIPAS